MARATVVNRSSQLFQPVDDLLNLSGDLTVDVLQDDRVDACQLYLVEGY